tara:strand:+ start:293 stop:1966 length:1674 start_codon:yes stop_codon:yes gene_type:complete
MTEGDESLNEARESEAAIRSAAKALKERESTQRAIVDLSKKLNDALTKEKGLLGDIEKGQGNIKNILKQQETRQKLIRNLEQERQTLLLNQDELSSNQVLNIQAQIDAAKQLGALADGEVDKLKEKNILIDLSKSQMDTLNTLTGGLAEKAVDFVNALKANPMVLIASAIVGLIKMMLEVGNAAAEIGRNLGVGAKEARAINQSFNSIASNSKDFTQTAAKIGQAMNLINEGLGTSATLFGGALLDTMSTLQNRMGLTADATFGLYQAASLSGKSMEETYLSAFATSAEVGKQTGILLNHKSILEETGKTTGQIRAQLGGSSDAIQSAIARARVFGMELKEVAAAGKQLLDFEQSISAELEAELITGKQLNLEKARLAALTGDYELLTEEINANVGDFSEFSKLNVLQQEQLARAVGMEADQLSNVLMKRANLDQLAQEAENRGERELANNYMQLSLQQKFNAALEKLKVLVVNIVTKLESGFGFMDILGGSPLDDGLFSVSSESYKNFGKEADIEGAVERGLSKARISVSTRYSALDGVEGSNHQNVKFTSKMAGN